MRKRTVVMPAGEPTLLRLSAPRSAGIGLHIPERASDCSGWRTDWYPFQINVCDEDEQFVPFLSSSRHRRVPGFPSGPIEVDSLLLPGASTFPSASVFPDD